MSESGRKLLVRGFGLGGYRSLAQSIQWLDPLGQVNLIIGENNLGKSNLLHYIAEDYLNNAERPKIQSSPPAMNEADLNKNIPKCTLFFGLRLAPYRPQPTIVFQVPHPDLIDRVVAGLGKGNRRVLFHLEQGYYAIHPDEVKPYLGVLSQDEWELLASTFADDDRKGDLVRSAQSVIPRLLDFHENKVEHGVIYIPAKRESNKKERLQKVPRNGLYFDGGQLATLIAQHKNPDDFDAKIPLYERMLSFVRAVVGDENAHINVPNGTEKIQVKLNNKTTAWEDLGTGIQEIVLIAAAASFHSNHIICIEEPEVHVHPAWQKRLVRELLKTSNQYFIASHSAHMIDIPGVAVFRLEGSAEGTKITHAVSARQKAEVCDALGYKPSDLMQTNCIIWVEGPSDRIYLNHWLSLRAPDLVESVHYMVMIYGGSLGTHITAEELLNEKGDLEYPEELDYLINVRKLNHRLVIVLDSDRKTDGEELTPVKERLIEEFDKGPGFAWITSGRTIENYFQELHVVNAMKAIHPYSKPAKDIGKGKYRLLARLEAKSGKRRDAKKVKIAECLIQKKTPVRTELQPELEQQMERLISFIRASNDNK